MLNAPVQKRRLRTRAAAADDAVLIQQLYQLTPGYFDIISIPLPALTETRTELMLALGDERRFVELVLAENDDFADWDLVDPATGLQLVGLVDYKLDYPGDGDGTVNLILVPGDLQSRGVGRTCVGLLEERLRGRCHRLLAAIYGQNPRAEQFWKSLGYRFAIDAKPNLDWYAKELPL